MNNKAQLVCVWIGLIGGILIGIGQYGLMNYMPPRSAAWDAVTMAAYFKENQTAMLAGSILLQMGYAGVLFMCVTLAVLIKRMEGQSNLWTYMWILSTGIAYFASFFAYAVWTTAAFRPDRPAEIIQAINDLGAISYVGLVSPALPQFGSLGLAILGDKSPNRLFPRWVGYLNIWTAIGSMPSAFIGFFHDGPFAWNGIIGFWVAVGIYCFWVPIMVIYTRKALIRLIKEEGN